MQAEHQSDQATTTHRDLRRHPRVPYSVPIALHDVVAGIPQAFHGISLDISEGGLGALVSGSPRIGDRVLIELSLGKDLLCLTAILRHKSGPRAGFEFLDLSADDKRRITATVGHC